MRVQNFTADTAAEALVKVRAELGSDAVVLNVRKAHASGFGRLWKAPRIELTACLPEESKPAAPEGIDGLREELAALRREIPLLRKPARSEATPLAAYLEERGLSASHAASIALAVGAGPGDGRELPKLVELARGYLRERWPETPATRDTPAGAHLFLGAPGVGKTTVLCKWLAGAVLLENQRARVLRLDGRVANAAESLSVYCDILGVPLERSLGASLSPEDLVLIDLPGIPWQDDRELETLRKQIDALPACQIHLVLNAAYETSAIFKQIEAFSAFPLSDLIFTHLDEETRWGKLWNFRLGTNFSIAFLSAGQNIPGKFEAASAEALLAAFSQENGRFIRESEVFS